MAIRTIKATIQMRHGREEDFDPDQMTAGEWGVSDDTKKVWMCFMPGLVFRMATYEAFEKDMQEIREILAACQDIQEAVKAFEALAEQHKNQAEVYSNESKSWSEASKSHSKVSESWAKTSESWAVGGTGTRDGEDSNNAKYYSQHASDLSKSWAVGGTGVRPGENVNNSKYFAEETKKLLEEASDNVNPTKYSVNQKKQVTLSTLQRVTIKDEYTNSEIAGVYFYLDLDSFSFQKDYLYTEPDNGQPLEDFYDESDSDYNFSANVVKYYIYVCNKDTGNVLDSMSVDINPYYYSGGAEEFLSDIASNYYFYDKTKQDYVESSVAPSGVNTYYETSGYVYAYANSSSLLNNILIHDTAADIIFSGSNRVYGSGSGSTISASSLKSLVDYMGSSDSKKGIVFITFRNYGSANYFVLIGCYETNVLVLTGDVYTTTLERILLAINKDNNTYITGGILDNRYIDINTISIIGIKK